MTIYREIGVKSPLYLKGLALAVVSSTVYLLYYAVSMEAPLRVIAIMAILVISSLYYCLSFIFSSAKIENEFIYCFTFVGKYRISFADINKIEKSAIGYLYKFEGDNKQLILSLLPILDGFAEFKSVLEMKAKEYKLEIINSIIMNEVNKNVKY